MGRIARIDCGTTPSAKVTVVDTNDPSLSVREQLRRATTRRWYVWVVGAVPACLGVPTVLYVDSEATLESWLLKTVLVAMFVAGSWSIWAELLTEFDQDGFKTPLRRPVSWCDVVEVRSSAAKIVFLTTSSSRTFRVGQFRHREALEAFLRQNVPVLKDE